MTNLVGNLHIDLATKVNQYKGHAKISRLVHIIQCSKDLAIPALKLLYEHLQFNSKDVQRAKSVAATLASMDKTTELNTDWIIEKQRQCIAEKQKLADDLSKATAAVYATHMAVSKTYPQLRF